MNRLKLGANAVLLALVATSCAAGSTASTPVSPATTVKPAGDSTTKAPQQIASADTSDIAAEPTGAGPNEAKGSLPATDTGRSSGIQTRGISDVRANPDEAVPVTFRFQVFANRNGIRHTVAPGQSMYSGDKLAFSIDVDRAAYVYLVQFFPGDDSAVIYPEAGEDNQVYGSQRIPARGWFQLDDVTGQETIYVIVSERPLEEVDQKVKRVLDDIRVSAANGPASADSEEASAKNNKEARRKRRARRKKQRNKDRRAGPKVAGRPKLTGGVGSGAIPAPGGLSLATRGLFRVADDDAAAVHGSADKQGIAIYDFSFNHIAR